MEVIVRGFAYPPVLPFRFGEALVPAPANGQTFAPEHPGATTRSYGGPKEAGATRLATAAPGTRNKGRHIVHLGGRYESSLSYDELRS